MAAVGVSSPCDVWLEESKDYQKGLFLLSHPFPNFLAKKTKYFLVIIFPKSFSNFTLKVIPVSMESECKRRTKSRELTAMYFLKSQSP
jgi:hypothetical protein